MVGVFHGYAKLRSSTYFNTGKIGLLPKRPVSLLQTDNASAHKPTYEDEDEDELEYVENPFEDHK
jgi:hypothetical protein